MGLLDGSVGCVKISLAGPVLQIGQLSARRLEIVRRLLQSGRLGQRRDVRLPLDLVVSALGLAQSRLGVRQRGACADQRLLADALLHLAQRRPGAGDVGLGCGDLSGQCPPGDARQAGIGGGKRGLGCGNLLRTGAGG